MATRYYCRGCGGPDPHPKKTWYPDPCPSCGQIWNIQSYSDGTGRGGNGTVFVPDDERRLVVSDYSDFVEDEPRIEIGGGLKSIDIMFGGDDHPGFLKSSTILFSGDAGSGKSTLMNHILRELSKKGYRCLFVSAEESVRQFLQRSKRLGPFKSPRLEVTPKRNLDEIFDEIQEMNANVVAIDSLQKIVCESPVSNEELLPGSMQAITVATDLLNRFAHKEGISIFIIARVTRDGSIAGPTTGLNHEVDTVVYFSRTGTHGRRLAIKDKNRGGPLNISVKCRMTATGLVDLELEHNEDDEERERKEKEKEKRKKKVAPETPKSKKKKKVTQVEPTLVESESSPSPPEQENRE